MYYTGPVSELQLFGRVSEQRAKNRRKHTIFHDRNHDGSQWIALLTMDLAKAAKGEMSDGPGIYLDGLISLAALALDAIEAEIRRED